MLTFGEIDLAFGDSSNDVKLLGYPAVQAYLRKRGINPEDMDTFDLRIVPAQQLKEMTLRSNRTLRHDERLAIVIPHFDFQRQHIEWWSSRLVDSGLKTVVSFSQFVQSGKMLCPPNEPPHAYLPPVLGWTFKRGDRVYIHESAIKAINGAKLGGWHIGLNGVWGWTSKKHEQAIIPELRNIPWKAQELIPVIVFDSNWEDNGMVRLSIAKLGAKIQEISGQRALHLPLPRRDDGGHQGFDDYRMAVGDDEALAFLSGEGVGVDIGELETMKLKLNTEVCVVRSLGRIAEQETGTLMTRATFTDVNYAHYTAWVARGEGEVQTNVPKMWLADARRLEVEALAYMPGSDRIADGCMNLWRGMGLEADEGDVEPWLALLRHNVEDESLRKWIIQWFAYPLQNLGEKMTSYIHLFGPPGTGKQALLAPLMRIYGRNAVVIGKREIESDFNSVYSNKQLINLDEIHGGSEKMGVTVANRIKMLTTSEKLPVNAKGAPEYIVRNCANLVSTANYADAIRLDDDDRRCGVIKFGLRGGQWNREQFVSYFAWSDGAGAAALYSYLLGVDMSGFDPKGWAPMTEHKGEMINATRRPEEQWVSLLWDDPDSALNPAIYKPALCLMTGAQLAGECHAGDPQGVSAGRVQGLGKRLYEAGFGKIELKVGHRKERFWIIRERLKEWDAKSARHHLKIHGYPGL